MRNFTDIIFRFLVLPLSLLSKFYSNSGGAEIQRVSFLYNRGDQLYCLNKLHFKKNIRKTHSVSIGNMRMYSPHLTVKCFQRFCRYSLVVLLSNIAPSNTSYCVIVKSQNIPYKCNRYILSWIQRYYNKNAILGSHESVMANFFFILSFHYQLW